MANVKVFIDNSLAELSADAGVQLVLTFGIKQKEGIETNTGTRSEYSFEFPCTKTNDEIFQRFYDVAELNEQRQVFLDATIEIDGMTFFKGKCQLVSATLSSDAYYWKGDKYKVAFFGNNVDWVIDLKDKYLYQYDFGVHTYARNDIFTAWSLTLPSFYKYVLIKWKDWDVYGQVDALESTPALFIVSIVRKIFESIGYTVNSNFMSSTWFEKLVLPVPLPEKLGDDFSDAYQHIEAEYTAINWAGFSGVFFPMTQTVAPTIGANPFVPATSIYTVPYDGYYLCEFSATLTNITTTAGFVFGFSINGAVISYPAWGQFNLSPVQPYTADTTISGAYVFLLSAGDTIEVAGAGGAGGIGTVDLFATLKITGELEIKEGCPIDFRYIMPKNWKSIDFIKGLAHAFNLVFETNTVTREILIEPADAYVISDNNPTLNSLENGFYLTGLANTVDKTQEIDLSKGGELESMTDIGSKIRFAWKDDGADPTVEALNGINDNELKLYEGMFQFTANRFKDEETVIENPFFAATVLLADLEIVPAVYEKTPMIPIIWKENYLETSTSAEKNINVLPRLLYSDAPTASKNGIFRFYDGITVLEYDCPFACMVDFNDSTGNQTSLSFSNQNVNGNEIIGLMQRFYLKNLIRMQTGKRLQTFMFWDAILLQNLTFRDKIRIHGDEYILQEINAFNVAKDDSTKTYLLYDAKGIGGEESQIENSKVSGIITTE